MTDISSEATQRALRIVRRPIVPPAAQIRRIGIQRRPTRDIYHFLLRASWGVLFGLFVAFYLTLNALFAALYTLDDQAIVNAQPGSYRDAFFFSVQTLATIGYGNMAPHSFYAHVLVTIEALVGVVSFALAAGLMFAKFSTPTARILFSTHAVITKRDGVPSLMFRMANERTSQVVEAQLRVTITRDEVTVEGERMRRFHDLKLLRDRTPIFSLTFTAIHPIDNDSPLYGATPQTLAACRAEIVATFVGLDEITLQSIHARHSFIRDEILFNMRLVDILSVSPDGARVVDYRRFHDVEPVAPTTA